MGALPTLPQVTVDTTLVAPTGTIYSVANGQSFQAALDAAQLGDCIELEAGASWRGTFHLRNRTTGSGWITVRTSRHAELPPPGTRVSPTNAALMATLVAPGSAHSIEVDEGAHHYRVIGIEVTGEVIASTVQNYAFINLDSTHYVGGTRIDQTTLAQAPHHMIFDRCYVHAGPDGGGEYIRGFVWNSAETALIDSHVSGFKARGADTQTLAGWNGPGPFKIQNNYLEAAGENVAFGGSRARIPDLIPSDIEIRGNLFSKPLSWRPGDPSFAGITWSVKNLLEFKTGQRVLIEENIFQDHWGGGQSGYFLQMTPRTEGTANPWVVVSDVLFRNNLVRRTTAGISVSAHDIIRPEFTNQISKRNAFLNNVFEDVGIYVVPGSFNGEIMMLNAGPQDFTFAHNTVFNTATMVRFNRPPSEGLATGLVIHDNIMKGGGYLIAGDGTGFGITALNAHAPGWVIDHNVIYAPRTDITLPPGNSTPATVADVGFVDLVGKDYRLAATSPYRLQASDGTDPGAILDVTAATPAAVTLTITAPSIVVGDNATIGLTLTSSAGAPTGSIGLAIDSDPIVTLDLVHGEAIYTLLAPAAGDHPLVASYAGNATFGSAGAFTLLHVDPLPAPPPPSPEEPPLPPSPGPGKGKKPKRGQTRVLVSW